MKRENIAPAKLAAVNAPNPEKVARLAASMKANGWGEHRPLLVEEVRGDHKPFPMPRLYAWTGSNRIVAAEQAGLESVPCLLMTAEEMNRYFSPMYGEITYGYSSWRSALAGTQGGGDKHRLSALERVGFVEAADAMREEINSPEG